MDTQEQALVETVSDEILDTLGLIVQYQNQYLPQDPGLKMKIKSQGLFFYRQKASFLTTSGRMFDDLE